MRLVPLDRPPLRLRRSRGRGRGGSPHPGRAPRPPRAARSSPECRRSARRRSPGRRAASGATAPPGCSSRRLRRTAGSSAPSSARICGHWLRQNFQELVDDLPMRGELLRNEVGEPRETCPLGRHGVEKPGEAGGECGRLARQQRGLTAHPAPFHDQLRQQQTPAQLGDGGRHVERFAIRRPAGQGSARPNRGRRSAACAAAGAAFPASRPAGDARRKASRRARTARRVGSRTVTRGQSQRVTAGHPQQPAGERRQKWPLGRDRVDLGGRPLRHPSTTLAGLAPPVVIPVSYRCMHAL